MTPEQQRIAIAEACGWKSELTPFERHSSRLEGYPKAWWHPDIAGCRPSPPDYLHDLNAMHEAEKVLTTEQCETYWEKVNSTRDFDPSKPWRFCLLHATATQRAEAFLRTLGQWQGHARAAMTDDDPDYLTRWRALCRRVDDCTRCGGAGCETCLPAPQEDESEP